MSTQVKSETIEELSINTIRTLSMDAVQAANSGHPGTPMAMAPLVYCLWQRLLRFDPDNPIWMTRARFVLSAGHSSMQLESKCSLHPEYCYTSGVETTTGQLCQGVATSVGMAMAARWFAAHFNRPGFELFDYNVYALGGDGCMMEGISSETAS